MNPKLRLLHLLAAFPLGLIIAIISFSGAMLALEDSLTPLLQPKQTKVEQVLTAQKPAADIVASVQRAIPDSFSVTSITYANDPQATVRVGYSESRRSAMVADPYTAQVVGKQERHPFFMTMFRLHRWLLDKPGGLGNQIVGASVVLFIIALLSGLVIWWPKTWSTFRKKARIVTGRGRHPFFYSLHGAGGFFASIFLLLLALTGLTWTYAPYKKAFYGVFGLEAPQRGGAPAGKDKAKGGRPDGKPEGKPAEARGQRPEGGENRGQGRGEQDARTLNTAQWQAVLAQLQQKHPNWNEITLEDGKASVKDISVGNTYGSERYEFDAATGAITKHSPASDTPANVRLNGWIHVLHMGTFAGAASRYLWFVIGLIGTALPLTGYYLYYKRRSRRKKPA